MSSGIKNIKRICLLDNPKSGTATHANRVKVLFHLIEDCGFCVTWEELTSLEQTLTVMDAHIESGCDLFVVSGGDGTVRSVAHHLTGRRIPLLIFPAGNENLLATELGLQARPSEALKVIQQARYKDIDVAHINGLTCIAVAGVGIDAAIVHLVHCRRKGHINKLNYVWAAIQTLFTYRHTKIDIRIDDRKIDCEKAFALVGNIPRYGGGFNVFKDAAYDDGFLDITVFRCSNFLQLTSLFIFLVCGKLEKSSRVEFYKGKNIVMSSPGSTLRSQVDGDPGPSLPLNIQVVPAGLRLLVP